jgi:drug/metabolite transporter (DMT)-like permease
MRRQPVDEQVTPEPAPPASPSARPRRHGSWILAAVIIVVGVVFLIKNTGWLGEDWDFDNWWALFILVPAFGSFANAWNSYVTGGRRFNSNVARSLMFGLVFLAITIIFLLKLDWSKVWPVLVIIIGVGMVLGWKRD